MKIILQRVDNAELKINNKTIADIKKGLLLLIGISHNDTKEKAKYLAEKCINLRIFEDSMNKMNLSVNDIKGEILAVSQFTLYGNTTKGRRPSFENAADPKIANNIYNKFIEYLKQSNLNIQTGIFGEHMIINLTNNGPVTFILEK